MTTLRAARCPGDLSWGRSLPRLGPLRTTWLRTWLLAGLLLILSQAASGQPRGLPAQLGELERVRIENFEDRQRGLGKGFIFRGPRMHVTIYEYDLDLRWVPEGIEAEPVRAQFAQAMREVVKVHQDAVQLGQPVSTRFAGVDFLAVSYRYKYANDGPEVVSHLLLTGHHGQYVKIRIDQPLQDDERDKVMRLRNFLEKLGEALQGK